MKTYIKQVVRNNFWRIYGRQIGNPPLIGFPRRILFICKGNICRSPFAEKLSRKILSDKDLDRISVESAGFMAIPSESPPKEAISSALYFGVHLEGHIPIKVDKQMMQNSDMILVMEVAHQNILKNNFHWKKNNIYILPLYANTKDDYNSKTIYNKYNISDPYGKDEDVFMKCYIQIENCIHGLMKYIRSAKQRG